MKTPEQIGFVDCLLAMVCGLSVVALVLVFAAWLPFIEHIGAGQEGLLMAKQMAVQGAAAAAVAGGAGVLSFFSLRRRLRSSTDARAFQKTP